MKLQRIPGSRLERAAGGRSPRDPEAESWKAAFRVTPLTVYALAWLFLAGAVGAVAIAQFTASGPAPWLAMGYSAGAVLCTVLAVVLRPRTAGASRRAGEGPSPATVVNLGDAGLDERSDGQIGPGASGVP
jgi:hypothetical protein